MSRLNRRRPSVPRATETALLPSDRPKGSAQRLRDEADPDQEFDPQILAVMRELAIVRNKDASGPKPLAPPESQAKPGRHDAEKLQLA